MSGYVRAADALMKSRLICFTVVFISVINRIRAYAGHVGVKEISVTGRSRGVHSCGGVHYIQDTIVARPCGSSRIVFWKKNENMMYGNDFLKEYYSIIRIFE